MGDRWASLTRRAAPALSWAWGGGLGFAIKNAWISAFFIAFYLAPAPARAAFEVNDDAWQGTSELLRVARQRLGADRVKPIALLEWDVLRPEDALLVLHPERELDYREASAFLASGGRLGLLDDYGRGDALLSKFRIHRMEPPVRPREAVRGNPSLSVAVPALERVAGAEQGRHPIVASVDRVVTNHATVLRTEPGVRLTPVLEIPALGESDSLLAVIGVIGDAKACGLVEDTGAAAPAATVPRERCGRLFAMGDPSSAINLMLRYPGNRAFVEGLIDYLTADDTWGRRGGTLYIATNDFAQRGLYGGSTALKRSLNDRIQAVEELFADMRHNGLPAALAVALAALLALGASVFVGRVSLRLYPRAAPRYARPTALVSQGGVAGRAAVLSARTTHRALTVLELKAALEETLSHHLELPKSASLARLADELRGRRLLTPDNARNLDKLLSEMAKAETAVATSERIRIGPETVQRMRMTMRAILADIGEGEERRG